MADNYLGKMFEWISRVHSGPNLPYTFDRAPLDRLGDWSLAVKKEGRRQNIKLLQYTYVGRP